MVQKTNYINKIKCGGYAVVFDRFLEIGMKTLIEVTRDDKEYFFPSKVEDIDKDIITLGMPIKGGKTFFINIDEKIKIYFSRKGSFYCIEGEVEKKRYEPIPVITMRSLSPPYKKQKRSFFRLKIVLPIKIKICGTEDTFLRYTRDISGGGIKFSHSEPIEEGSNIEVKIPDILGEKIIKASVVRTERVDMREINKYDIAIEFVDLDERLRDEIVKFLLAKQRELRQKGVE